MAPKRSCSKPQKTRKKNPKRKALNECCRSYQYKQCEESVAEMFNNLETNDSQISVEDENASLES